jgi:NAD(P)H-quinone oxidoreductase subunit 4L
VVTIAAAEAAVGLAIVMLLYRNFHDIEVDKINFMKW